MWRVCLLLLLFCRTLPALGPEVTAAARDSVRLLPKDAPFARYLILPKDKDYRDKVFRKVLAFHVNSLSREPEYGSQYPAGETVVRIDLRDYGWKRETWEKLAGVEPYLHIDIERKIAAPVEKIISDLVTYDGRVYVRRYSRDGGRTWYTGDPPAVAPPRAEVRKDRAHAPWLPAEDIGYLAKHLQSDAPIVRADWFIYQTAVAKGRKAGYYDWLNLGTKQEDFFELVGADLKKAAQRKKEKMAAIAESGVTVNNRAIEWTQGFDGGVYRSFDFLTNVFKQNVTRILRGDLDPPEGDASEQYGPLSNGLFAYWLQNKAGVRQDVAPPDIASDKRSTSNDTQVHVMLSCVRCHVEGLRPLDDWMRKVYAEGNSSGLSQKDYEAFKKFQRLYLSDLDGQLKKDNAAFALALKKLNGPTWTPKLNADSYAEVWRRYADQKLDLKAMAEELETTEIDLLRAAVAYGKTYEGNEEPNVTALRAKGVTFRREHFEESYATFRLLLAGELKGVDDK